MKKFILLTGATGFIGSHVTERLLQDRAFQVVTIVRKKRAYKNVEKLASGGAQLVEGNFYDKTLLESIFRDFPIQYVIHLAAIRGEGFGSMEEYQRVNVLGTEALLDASFNHGVKRFIFCSSVGVLGAIPHTLPGNLMTPLNGDSAYHKSKILAEEKVRNFMNHGLDAYIVRPSITYGDGDNGFPLKLVALIKNKLLLFPHKDILIHLLNVEKLTDVFIKLLDTEHLKQRVLIVADKEPILLRELADLIHNYYYGKKYPSPFVLPEFLLISLLFVLRTCESRKWLTRLRLISQSWYYDTNGLASLPGLTLSDTKTEFPKYLHRLNDPMTL